MFFCAIQKSPQPRIITLNCRHRIQLYRIRGCGERKERKRLHITSPAPCLKQKIVAASYARFLTNRYFITRWHTTLQGHPDYLPATDCPDFINKKPLLYS
ncbi:hypothetical protein CIX30_26880 [Salmonella enterica]|uniref:Uncharacterized protein n=1 Tax=Salmonella enterica I TaxID=59201 RepID=A0A3R1AX01_SALET|nr:hypothetical protein [Salmonella enterica]EBQ9005074.1 hypothetical protein [Salmonella enterica subsp. enterica serovar Blockley]ECU7994747.1 hypothetical protein [Salmonella enterica subsp. enterica serovar Toucra]MML55541.1 hypothetical protein [Salmonella enterica subsp. enterica serovar Kidderminster]EBN6862900.1 hypothetical protein [Salmonella enterica]